MGKVVLMVLLVVVAVFWLRHQALGRRGRHRDAAAQPPDRDAAGATGGPRTDQPVETMVSCARCGLNVPQRESVTGQSGQPYCSREHRALAGEGRS